MADIREAVLWIKEGHTVRRKSWPFYEGKWDGLRKANTPSGLLGRTGLSYDDLVANDWEIAE